MLNESGTLTIYKLMKDKGGWIGITDFGNCKCDALTERS